MPTPNHPMPALLALSIVLFVAAAASAQVPDGTWTVTDKKDSGTTAVTVLDGDEAGVVISGVCVPFPAGNATTGSAIEFRTDHPDRVSVKKSDGSLAQGEKSNPGTVRLITGSGTLRKVTNLFECKKIEIEASVDTKKSPNTGKFQGKASDCTCPPNVQGTCKNFLAQSVDLTSDCAPSNTIKFDFWSKKDQVRKITVKGKGDAATLE